MKGKVYKIINSVNKKLYVGSTFLLIEERLERHKHEILRKHMKLYDEMKEIGFNNFSILLIEEINTESRSELLKLENKYINKFRSQYSDLCLNSISSAPSIEEKKATKKKYYLKHKDKTYKIMRAKITKNKESHEKYKAYMKKYSETYDRPRVTCECGMTLYKSSLSRHLVGSIHTKRIAGAELIECECGAIIRKTSKYMHMKQSMHMKKMNLYYLNLLPKFYI